MIPPPPSHPPQKKQPTKKKTNHPHTHTSKVNCMSSCVSWGTHGKQNTVSTLLPFEVLLFVFLSSQELRANPKFFVSTGLFPVPPRFLLTNYKCKGGQIHCLFLRKGETVTAFYYNMHEKKCCPPSAAFDLWLQSQKAWRKPNEVKKRNNFGFTSHCLEKRAKYIREKSVCTKRWHNVFLLHWMRE